jgi:hypothetical protein
VSTTVVLVSVVGGGLVYVAWLLYLEVRAARDNVPDNYITNVMRKCVKREPWIFILLALVAGAMMGHCYLQ